MSEDFAHRLTLASLPHGKRMSIAADEAERKVVARRLGLLELERFEASGSVARDGEEVRLIGRLRAAAVQACVASGEPVPATIDEPFEIVFRPEPTTAPDEEIELSEGDCDVVFHDGREIDLGLALSDSLALALDPYPRSAAAADVLKEAGVLSEGEAGPFAALAALKGKPQS